MSRSFLSKLKDPKIRLEFLKYISVGVLTSLVDFGVMAFVIYFATPSVFNYNYFNAIFNVPTEPGLAPATSTVIFATGLGFIISFCLNYLLSVFFVYKYGNIGRNKHGFIKFMIIALIGLTVHSLGGFIGYQLLGLNIWLVKIVISVIVFVFNYVMRKVFIFNIDLIINEDTTIQL